MAERGGRNRFARIMRYFNLGGEPRDGSERQARHSFSIDTGQFDPQIFFDSSNLFFVEYPREQDIPAGNFTRAVLYVFNPVDLGSASTELVLDEAGYWRRSQSGQPKRLDMAPFYDRNKRLVLKLADEGVARGRLDWVIINLLGIPDVFKGELLMDVPRRVELMNAIDALKGGTGLETGEGIKSIRKMFLDLRDSRKLDLLIALDAPHFPGAEWEPYLACPDLTSLLLG